MKHLSAEELAALNLLARRNNKDYQFKSSYQWTDLHKEIINFLVCLICHQELILYDYTVGEYKDTFDHGRMHLKEHNLLVFL